MLLQRLIGAVLLTMLLLCASVASAQTDRTTGSIKGKVRADKGPVEGVEVVASQSNSEVRRAVTNRKGEFLIQGLAPGLYGLTFRKPGLSVGRLESIEVRAGKVRSLPDRLYLKVDEGSLAFIRGSVFTAEGKSVPNARVELARIQPDGSAKKIDGRITNETGLFVFRLVPDTAKYRISVWAGDAGPITKDIEIDGPARYNIALQLPAR